MRWKTEVLEAFVIEYMHARCMWAGYILQVRLGFLLYLNRSPSYNQRCVELILEGIERNWRRLEEDYALED